MVLRSHTQPDAYLSPCVEKLKARLDSLIEDDSFREEEFNQFILVTQNLLEHVRTPAPKRGKAKRGGAKEEPNRVVSILSDIVLRPALFKRIGNNCLILKVFQELLLSGSSGFDIDGVSLQKDANGEYSRVWLLGDLLLARFLPSLAGLANLRR